jgi:hypothetical protein
MKTKLNIPEEKRKELIVQLKGINDMCSSLLATCNALDRKVDVLRKQNQSLLKLCDKLDSSE